MASALENAGQVLRKRIKELEPLVAEHQRLVRAVEQLVGNPVAARDTKQAKPARRRKPRSRSTTSRTSAKRTRGKRSQTRTDQFLELIHKQPGITVAAAADAMGVGREYLYRIGANLQKTGAVTKTGRGFTASRATEKAAAKAK